MESLAIEIGIILGYIIFYIYDKIDYYIWWKNILKGNDLRKYESNYYKSLIK